MAFLPCGIARCIWTYTYLLLCGRDLHSEALDVNIRELQHLPQAAPTRGSFADWWLSGSPIMVPKKSNQRTKTTIRKQVLQLLMTTCGGC